MLRARTGWTRARQSRIRAATAEAAALAVGCSGGDGTAVTGRGALRHISGIGSLGSGCGREQGTCTAGPGHEHAHDSWCGGRARLGRGGG